MLGSKGLTFEDVSDPPTLYSQDLIINSPYCEPQNSYEVSTENWVLFQLIIP